MSKSKVVVGYLIDVNNGTHGSYAVERSLENYYKILNCDCIDMTRRTIDRKPYVIMCDDEGLLKDNPKVSAIDKYGEPMLCGNLFIVKVDGWGETVSLTTDDIDFIDKHVCALFSERHTVPYPVLMDCGY